MHKESNQVAINWNEISDLGLLQRINKEVMHPLGLAIYRNPEDGNSPGALVADDGVWEYSPEMTNRMLSNDEVAAKVQQLLAQEKQIENTNG
jgi:hypothetical protein